MQSKCLANLWMTASAWLLPEKRAVLRTTSVQMISVRTSARRECYWLSPFQYLAPMKMKRSCWLIFASGVR